MMPTNTAYVRCLLVKRITSQVFFVWLPNSQIRALHGNTAQRLAVSLSPLRVLVVGFCIGLSATWHDKMCPGCKGQRVLGCIGTEVDRRPHH